MSDDWAFTLMRRVHAVLVSDTRPEWGLTLRDVVRALEPHDYDDLSVAGALERLVHEGAAQPVTRPGRDRAWTGAQTLAAEGRSG